MLAVSSVRRGTSDFSLKSTTSCSSTDADAFNVWLPSAWTPMGSSGTSAKYVPTSKRIMSFKEVTQV